MTRSRYVVVAVIVVLGCCGGAFAWRWQQRGPGHASVAGALDRYRSSSTLSPVAHELQPAPGVYLYRGSGSEKLSFLSTAQGQGPTEPGTVVLEPNGCWQFRIDFNSFHDQTWSRCAAGSRLRESGGTTTQRFDFVTFKMGEHSTVVCDPPFVLANLAVAPGTSSPVHCSGRSETTKATFTQSGTATFVGRVRIRVGGTGVTALHLREVLRLTGGQTGTVHIDLWIAASNGLPLAEAHDIRVVSPAPKPLGQVTYAEQGRWKLTSTTPRT